MVDRTPLLRALDEDAALRTILAGTATETGERFFTALVESLCAALGTQGAWVTEYDPEARRLRSLAFRFRDGWIDDYEYAIDGTPCEAVVSGARLVHVPESVVALYPGDPDLPRLGAVSYLGVPLEDAEGRVLGHLAVLDSRPMPEAPRAQAIIRIFAARAAAELSRLRAEHAVREREAALARLIDGAMDAILELDEGLFVVRMNPAAEATFGCEAARLLPADFRRFLAPDGEATLRRALDDVEPRPGGRRSLWIPGGLTARRADGEPFPAEATLSRFESGGRPRYALILRNVNDRLTAERTIRSLRDEAAYLREEIRALQDLDEIVGESEAVRRVLDEIAQVAPTDASVLVTGETGTGKELVARAVHAASGRRDRPLVTVNCAAIPATLIESEFFGHERGAFTGATQRREGRFVLADGGTLVLDEVGELPIDLQAKLLRVLQDGEVTPVGGSRPRRVDVRVVAATNRDLAGAVSAGTFRRDLYYRLNVFPIHLPPLRERGDDVVLLAERLVRRIAGRMRRPVLPLSADAVRRLKAYRWPGNVRELQNVIERAVITARDGRLDLSRALPDPEPERAAPPPPARPTSGILTEREVRGLERENLRLALEAAGWRVAGADGAAARLGMKPSTLASRMKALGLGRPR